MSETARPRKPASKSASRPAPRAEAPQLPPRVVKKKKPVKRESSGERRERGPADPPSEFLVPMILIGVGLAANVATTLMLRESAVSLALWIGLRMTIIVVSALLTYGALFVAAQVLDTDYGYISTGVAKVAAITLTQSWVADVASEIPIPILPWIIATAATYGMFMYFFDLDLSDAIASVIVVRLVHWLAVVLLFVGVIGAIVGGKSLSGPMDIIAPAVNDADNAADNGDDDDDEPMNGPIGVPLGGPAGQPGGHVEDFDN